MKLLLVNMPWGSIEVPSLALGILRIAAESDGHQVEVLHANLEFVDWVVERAPFTLPDYTYYSTSSYFQGAGDWVFSSALHGSPGDVRAYAELLAAKGASPQEIAMTGALHELAPAFITELADRLAAEQPEVVGFTTTFQQNTAALAVARLLKRLSPDTRIVFGGANCDGEMGAALHRTFPWVDFVVRGEGETALPALLAALDNPPSDGLSDDPSEDLSDGPSDERRLRQIPGLCWRDTAGTGQVNPMARRPLAPSQILTPVYDGFFERLDSSIAAGWVQPRLPVEGSRGCWWGEKHHCTFCGLNGSFMEFRSKSPERFHDELIELARRYQVLDFMVVDNILDMGYFDTVLRRLAESDHQLRLHFEVKSNLRRSHFRRLVEAGTVMVQPGIESLSSTVLKLMDKGVTGCLNVRALRDAQSTGVSVCWNYLYGFPGESAADYREIIRQLPMLHHLEPPGGSSRIAIERFSPYFDRPELGFPDLRPAAQYTHIYRLPEAETADLAYLFAAAPQGIGRPVAAELDAAIAAWHAAGPGSRLSYQDLGERIVLVNRRQAYDWTVLELDSPEQLGLFRLLDQPRTLATLVGRLGAPAEEVARLLAQWTDLGLVFHEDGSYLQVAADTAEQPLFRLEQPTWDEEEERHALAIG